MGFTKLISGITDSSIWFEHSDVLKVFITFWTKSSPSGVVLADKRALFRDSNLIDTDGNPLPYEYFNKILEKLMSPDESSKSKKEDGRRILQINESEWLIVNYKEYRETIHSNNPNHRSDREGFVYFAGESNRIKIGFSVNPWARVNELKVGNPRIILYSMFKGTMDDEKTLHDKYNNDSIGGEWFKISKKLISEIYTLTGEKITTATTETTEVGTPYASASLSASLSASELNNIKLLETFDLFRKKYPGTKRGRDTELDNFKKKHKDWKGIIPTLIEALENQIEWRTEMKDAGMFVPEWKNLKTWLNQRCWENEKPKIEYKNESPIEKIRRERNERGEF